MNIQKSDNNIIPYAFRMLTTYFESNSKDFYHAVRVASYVANNTLIPDEIMNNCIALALMHDLVEDTDYKPSGINNDHLYKCLDLLTRKKENGNYIVSYNEYIQKIKQYSEIYPEAYFVKLADIKDHFVQKETLTDSLKKKYIDALEYLL